jgi:conjugative transfer region protein TrbK
VQGGSRLPLLIGAAAFVGLASAAMIVGMRRGPEPLIGAISDPPADASADLFMAQLVRCSALGEPALRDQSCLDAWAEHRRRFLAPAAPRPEARP